jgi:hypothetical protein
MFYCTVVFVSRILMLQKSFYFHFTMSLVGMTLMSIYHRHCIKLWKYYLLIRNFDYYTVIFSFARVSY